MSCAIRRRRETRWFLAGRQWQQENPPLGIPFALALCLLEEGFKAIKLRLRAPAGPGLGIEPDKELIAAYAVD